MLPLKILLIASAISFALLGCTVKPAAEQAADIVAEAKATATAQAERTRDAQTVADARATAAGLKGTPAPTATPKYQSVLPTVVIKTTAEPTSAPATKSLTCDGKTITVPENGQLFPATTWVNNQAVKNCAYDVVYDPSQSGTSYLPAKGWYYQPFLPGPHREFHEVPLVLQAGTYKFLGPECTVWLNADAQHGLDTGTLLVQRQNVEELSVQATAGKGTEAWVFVRCNESDASGFSFSRR